MDSSQGSLCGNRWSIAGAEEKDAHYLGQQTLCRVTRALTPLCAFQHLDTLGKPTVSLSKFDVNAAAKNMVSLSWKIIYLVAGNENRQITDVYGQFAIPIF